MTRARADRVRAAAVLVAAVALLLAPPGPFSAFADEPDSQPADVEKEAWYTAPTSEALPPVLTSEFPPGVLCVLVPEVCPEEIQEAVQPIEDVITGTPVPGGPIQPVFPGTLPVGMLGGHPRYTSVLKFDLPPAPPGAFVDEFILTLHEHDFSFAVESPAFRALMRAFIAQATDDRGPGPFIDFFQAVAGGDEELLVPEPIGVEACLVTEDWEPAENEDVEEQPSVDCILGATGERQGDGTWIFDLTFAVSGWFDGTMANHGIYLGPLDPENLEYGDPDLSANFIVSFQGAEADEGSEPRIVASFSEPLPPPPPPPPPPVGAPPPAFGPVFEPGFPAQPPPPPPSRPEQPTAAPPPVQTGATGDPRLPGWVWLLLPLGAAATVLFARSLAAEPALAVARSGALTRLAGDIDVAHGAGAGEGIGARFRSTFAALRGR